MDNSRKLLFVKLSHTAIWGLFVSIILYIVYSGLADRVTDGTWIAIVLIAVEGVVLLLNKGDCPLTNVAARYTEGREENFDIFLPLWLAKYNKRIFTLVYVVGIALVLWSARN